MLAEAIYKDGKIELTKKIQFKHRQFKLKVELPDEEIIVENQQNISPLVLSQAQEMLAKFDSLRNTSVTTSSDDVLTEKQQQRLEAMELRAQMRVEEGRPI